MNYIQNNCIINIDEECCNCGYCEDEKENSCILDEKHKCDGCNYCGRENEFWSENDELEE